MNLSELSDDELLKMKQETEFSISRKNMFQMAYKILANSVYGAMGNEYFIYYDVRLAESITLHGQYAIKFIEKYLNRYMNKLLDTKNEDYVCYMDTDSVVGDSLIYVNGEKIRIEDFYFKGGDFIKNDKFNENYIRKIDPSLKTLSVNLSSGEIEEKPIKYIMKHKVKKRMYEIKCDGKSVKITEDHSLIVNRDNDYISIKPKDILKNDEIIKII